MAKRAGPGAICILGACIILAAGILWYWRMSAMDTSLPSAFRDLIEYEQRNPVKVAEESKDSSAVPVQQDHGDHDASANTAEAVSTGVELALPSQLDSESRAALIFLSSRIADLRPGEQWYVMRNALLELLRSEAGADALAQVFRQADAATLRNYLLLLIWKCEDRECAWRGTSGAPELPAVVYAEILVALGELHSPRARACLEFCQYMKPVPDEAFPVAFLVFDEILATDPSPLDRGIRSAALDIATKDPERLEYAQVQALLAAAADFGSPRSGVLGYLGRLDPADSGPVMIDAIRSDDPEARLSAFQTIYYRYWPTELPAEPFERDFAMTVIGRLVDSERPALVGNERFWISHAAIGMPTRELAYTILDALAATEVDAQRRIALESLAAGMARGRDRKELQREISSLHW